MGYLFFTFLLVLQSIPALALIRPHDLHARDLVTGKTFDLKSAEGSPLVVVFLSSVCPCSDSHRSELTQLKADFPRAIIVGVNANADEDLVSAKSYFEKSGLPFPVIRDPGSKLANDLKALRTPHAFLFSPEGNLVYQGGVSSVSHFEPEARKYLREALEDVTANRKVRTAQARPLGCIIERED